MGKTTIEWTDETWNPVTGCTKVSAGCKNCYAERITERFGRQKFTDIILHRDRVDQPFKWKKPRMVFVNSMSDLFHEDIPDGFIVNVFCTMVSNQRHTFQVLTKRPERMREVIGNSRVMPNVWLGVSCEDQETANERIPCLLQTPAAVRFVSCEPLLGPIDFYECGSLGPEMGDPVAFSALKGFDGGDPVIPGIDWVIAGGESGPGFRAPIKPWFESIRDQCLAAKVPFFFKQWGGRFPKSNGRILDGRTWDEMP